MTGPAKVAKLLLITYFISLLTYPTTAIASAVFEDDFETNTDQWSVQSGVWDWQSVDGSMRYGSTFSSCCAESVAGDINWDDYVYELDLLGKQGVDKNAMFRYTASNSKYGIHMTNTTISLEKHIPGSSVDLTIVPADFTNDTVYKVKILADSDNLKIYVDDTLYIDYTDTNSPLLTGKIGLRVGAGAISPSEVWFDNVKVTEIEAATATPTPSPTPSHTLEPTAAPTQEPTSQPTEVPSPTPIILNVPYFRQFDLPWKNLKYDHLRASIEEYGCALTSAAMVLVYHGHDVTPESLNSWLRNQPDGFLRGGLVNWLAVTRYSKINENIVVPALEYLRKDPTNQNILYELENSQPAIVKVPGHFVVTTGINGNTFSINDPGYENRINLSDYPDLLALNTFTPSHTDLSYIMFVADSNLSLKLVDENGVEIEAETYVEDPINNLLNSNKKSGQAVSVLILDKPKLSKYKLKVQGPRGSYKLDTYIYDTGGNVKKQNYSGKIHRNETDSYTVSLKPKESKPKPWWWYFLH